MLSRLHYLICMLFFVKIIEICPVFIEFENYLSKLLYI